MSVAYSTTTILALCPLRSLLRSANCCYINLVNTEPACLFSQTNYYNTQNAMHQMSNTASRAISFHYSEQKKPKTPLTRLAIDLH